MTEWTFKRFWKTAEPARVDDGFTIELDGRPVRTPAKTLLQVPSEALAVAIAAEWEAQKETVNPGSMPLTRLANSALDKVEPKFDDVADMLADYGGSDLLCYRADGPQPLVDRQADAWNPLLGWAEESYEIFLHVQTGLMPVAQPDASIDRITAETRRLSAFELAGFHDLVALSGSWIIGFAVLQRHLTPQEGWMLSRIDEDWQAEQWGDDEEALEVAQRKKVEFLNSDRFISFLRNA